PRHASPPHKLVILGCIVAVARIVLNVHDLAVLAHLEAQAKLGDAGGDDVSAADEDRLHDALVDPGLHGAQHALVLAFRVHEARATISDGSACASSSSARTDASFISSLIVLAPQSSAPRKMNGKHSELLTWLG